jgi:hypothetical protein
VRLSPVFLSLLVLAGCGGVSTSNSPPAAPQPQAQQPPPPATPPANVGGGPAGTPVVVNVSAGLTAGGIDIAVPAPVASAPPNAQLLGVAPLAGAATASNTGATIQRGTTMRVVILGPGLDANTKVTIGGPADITVSNVRTTSATSGNPGISFQAVVASGAALGGRTVILENPQGDVTTFTGGLEVVP